MSLLDAVDLDPTPVVSFPASVGLWAAIVEQIAPRDPAGSVLAGPSWPGQPIVAERGMFELS